MMFKSHFDSASWVKMQTHRSQLINSIYYQVQQLTRSQACKIVSTVRLVDKIFSNQYLKKMPLFLSSKTEISSNEQCNLIHVIETRWSNSWSWRSCCTVNKFDVHYKVFLYWLMNVQFWKYSNFDCENEIFIKKTTVGDTDYHHHAL